MTRKGSVLRFEYTSSPKQGRSGTLTFVPQLHTCRYDVQDDPGFSGIWTDTTKLKTRTRNTKADKCQLRIVFNNKK